MDEDEIESVEGKIYNESSGILVGMNSLIGRDLDCMVMELVDDQVDWGLGPIT